MTTTVTEEQLDRMRQRGPSMVFMEGGSAYMITLPRLLGDGRDDTRFVIFDAEVGKNTLTPEIIAIAREMADGTREPPEFALAPEGDVSLRKRLGQPL